MLIRNTVTAIGFYTSFESIARLLAGIAAGVLWRRAGSEYIFLFSAGLTLAVIVYLLRIR